MTFICLSVPPLLFMPLRSSAAPSLAPLALSASLAAPQFSAASGEAPLASAHSALSPSYLRIPRLAPQSSAFPSFAGWSSDSAGPPAATHSSAGPRVPFAAPEPRPMWVSAWASAGSSLELECSVVRLAAVPYHVFPGFFSIDAGMYVRAAALHRRSPPLSPVLPSVGGTLCGHRCPVATASAFMSFMAKAAASSSVLLRSLFMFLLVNCFMRVPA